MRAAMSYAYTERHKAIRYVLVHWFVCLLVFWLVLWIFLPLSHYVSGHFSEKSLEEVLKFFNRSVHNPLVVWKEFGGWFKTFWLDEPAHYSWYSFIGWRLPLLPMLVLVMFAMHYVVDNPYDYTPHYFGYGRVATQADVRRMGLADGKYLFLGNLGQVKLRLPDTRSAICVGAPASGKRIL